MIVGWWGWKLCRLCASGDQTCVSNRLSNFRVETELEETEAH